MSKTTTRFLPGDRVLVHGTVRPKRYAGRTGVAPGTLEIGVKIGAGISWFLPRELDWRSRPAAKAPGNARAA